MNRCRENWASWREKQLAIHDPVPRCSEDWIITPIVAAPEEGTLREHRPSTGLLLCGFPNQTSAMATDRGFGVILNLRRLDRSNRFMSDSK